MFTLCRSDPFRWARIAHRSGPAFALPAALRCRHLPVHSHREELQAHAGQAAVARALRAHCQQHPNGDWSLDTCHARCSPTGQCLDAQC